MKTKRYLFLPFFMLPLLAMASTPDSLRLTLSELLPLGLPVVMINTPDSLPITSKMEWMDNVDLQIVMPDSAIVFSGRSHIKGHGNSTWRNTDKKPYAIKLYEAAPLLGMSADKRWVLLAEWFDRTLIRNAVSYKIAHLICREWNPHGRHINLVLNGEYRGVYFFCEKIKVAPHRIDITKMNKYDAEGDELTGGYLMELDIYFDEQNRFRSDIYNLPFMFKSPEEEILTVEQENYFKNYIAQMEEALRAGSDYEEWLDSDSFIDWLIANEMTGNREAVHPKSVFMFKDRGGKLKAGPLWDFDTSTFMPAYASGIYTPHFLYFPELMRSYRFEKQLCERWKQVRESLVSIPDYIDSLAAAVLPSQILDNQIWPAATNVNGDEQLTYNEAIEQMKRAIRIKWDAMDRYVQHLTDVITHIPANGVANHPITNHHYFDLYGRSLAAPPAKGVYIRNGMIFETR